MVLATQWTTRRDTQKLEQCSAQLRGAIIIQPWVCTTHHHEVLGLLRKCQAPTKQRRDPNPKRTTALAHTMFRLDDEQLYRLCAVGIAAWKEQNLPDGLKKEPGLWNCTSGGTVRRAEPSVHPLPPFLPPPSSSSPPSLHSAPPAPQSVCIFTTGTSHTTESIANKASIP